MIIRAFFLFGCLTCSACSYRCEYCSSSLRPPCGCDADCSAYKDCCTSYSNTTRNETASLPDVFKYLSPGVDLKCTSSHFSLGNFNLNGTNGYFMVTSCPKSGKDFRFQQKCRMSESQFLMPPVTDITTGLVYRNEYCARCNGVSELVSWGVTLECFSPDIFEYNGSVDILKQLNYCQPRRFEPAKVGKTLLRPCLAKTQNCLPFSAQFNMTESQYDRLVQLCRSDSIEPVMNYGFPDVYKNRACARCNLRNGECLPSSVLSGIPFTITLRSLNYNHILVEELDTDVMVSCPEGQVPVGLECRPTDCPSGYTLTGGTCSYGSTNCSSNITLSNSSYVPLGNGSVLLKSDSSIVEVLEYNDLGLPIVCKTLNCSTGLVALNASEYELLENGSIIFQNTLLEVHYYDDLNRTLICPERLPSAKNLVKLFPSLSGMQELTYIGCSLSIIGTLLLLLTYGLFPEFRTFPGLILMNLCTSILTTSLIFVIGSAVIHFHQTEGICSACAILLHYSYLTQFSWMTIFFKITKSFYQARKLVHNSKETNRKFFLLYLVIARILPLLLIVILVILNYSTHDLVLYGVDEQGETSYCWINQRVFLIITFLVPLVLSLSVNTITFAVTSLLLCQASRNNAISEQRSKTVAIFRVWFAAFLVTGLTWLFGFVAFIGGKWAWHLFVIFNSTQGLAISVTFIATKKIFNSYANKIRNFTTLSSLQDIVFLKDFQLH